MKSYGAHVIGRFSIVAEIVVRFQRVSLARFSYYSYIE